MKQLSVVTYNILAEAYVKPGRYPHSSAEALAAEPRRQRLLDQISNFAADVICLQEIERDAFDRVASRLSSHRGHFAQRQGPPDGLAIFTRVPAQRVEPLRDASLSSSGELIALIAYYASGLAIACTHLRWQPPGTPPSEHTGMQQLDRLMNHLDQAAAAYPARILAGDFNANSQSAIIEAAEARGYAISCRSQRPWDTTNINGRRRKLDYLLHTPERMTPSPGKLPKLQRDTPMPSLTYPSDHLPVQVLFRLAS